MWSRRQSEVVAVNVLTLRRLLVGAVLKVITLPKPA